MMPVVLISAPATGVIVSAEFPVTLVGQALDAEAGDLTPEIVWSSDVQGSLGTGASLTVLLSPGLHRVTANVTDDQGQNAEATVTITVG